jgi:hypothetical protein
VSKWNFPFEVDYTYPEFAKGAAANVPPRKRKIKMDAMFCDKAQPIWKHLNIKALE